MGWIALEKTVSEDEKPEHDDNAQTIKPINRSPSSASLLKPPPIDMVPIVEDYSDLAGDDEEFQLREKVEHFKVWMVPY